MNTELLTKIHFYLFVWDRFFLPPISFILLVLGLLAGGHALMHKRDPRAALGWTAVCVGIPGVGALLYLLFGVNRIRTRAQNWQDRGRWKFFKISQSQGREFDIARHLPPYERSTFLDLIQVSGTVTGLPLLRGNRITALYNGEEAYPKMLSAIRSAQRWVFLSTYIFETNQAGREFVQALAEALARGVEVRVLVDGAGTHYSRPRIQKLLKEKNIPYALFLPLRVSWQSVHMNLRTHRKILVVDGEVGFTGGMNIGSRHLVKAKDNPQPTQDIHFEIQGPILNQLKEAFLLDWHFAREEDRGEEFLCDTSERGTALCRGIVAGPNEDFEKLKWIVGSVFNAAKKNIRMMTPYFIPDRAMISEMISAVMRGVKVEIILPQKNNLPYVQWASQALLEELLPYGIQVYYQKPPFAHSKYLVVDDFYALIGSANLDPRSLRLNFEFNLEVYDQDLNQELTRHFKNTREKSFPITLEYLRQRSFPLKFRDSLAKLFAPYL